MRGKRLGAVVGVALAAVLTVSACGDDEEPTTPGSGGTAAALSGTVKVDGSSTVAPLSEAAAELFREEQGGVQITVGTSGTGGGFEKFCRGETDISDASRAIEDDEVAACEEAGIAFDAFQVANDALTVVVNKENTWAKCLTVDQLKTIWDEGSTVSNWNQVDPSFPDEPLKLFGAGTDSGTFDYFTAAVNGEEGRSRTDYQATEDDNVTVQGVTSSKGGLGYFGFSYYEENADELTAVQIDGGEGCVTPSVATAQDGTYSPLARPLFIYVNGKSLARPEVKGFVEFYLANSTAIAEQVQFVPLTDAQIKTAQDKLTALQASAGVTATPSS
ncbi:PstS family phosphate ABC transporter substrate-binding protein [Frankia sp. CNm7]|nr:PstS family phosphate ABC transporter substrate-binding protein [Frankia nepalensis]MBL7513858.1 PstS family phosphate ABC transporter substrate-binding protein [Frankia nepalensis]MBL7518376.1 PstS family phosphate ABC transporter substrate-binding protein [Frankia nepalensis]